MQRHGVRLLSRGVLAATGSSAAVKGAARVAVPAVQRLVEVEQPAAVLTGVGRQWRPFSGAPEVVGEEQTHDFESTTIADILRGKGSTNDGSWLFCKTDDTVYDAVKSMTSHNVGALLVMKADGAGAIAGIITERDYLRKIIVQGRSSKTTKVGDIMTDENKLITVTPDTKVLRAMELMTENRIRHIPVCENRKMKGMVSIGDVVGAVVKEHQAEVNRLSDYVKGSY